MSALAQVMAASLVEDKVQSSLFMTPFRSPEVQQLSGEAPCALLCSHPACDELCYWNSCPGGFDEVEELRSRSAGTPEAQGKAELLMAVISSINKWQGYTVGASRPVLYVAGSLSKHRKIIHEVSLFVTARWGPCGLLELASQPTACCMQTMIRRAVCR